MKNTGKIVIGCILLAVLIFVLTGCDCSGNTENSGNGIGDFFKNLTMGASDVQETDGEEAAPVSTVTAESVITAEPVATPEAFVTTEPEATTEPTSEPADEPTSVPLPPTDENELPWAPT